MAVSEREFVDYYELLQLSPNADDGMIRRAFRHLAKQYHPDTPGGSAESFNRLVEAHQVLADPESRAAYDARHQRHWQTKWAVASEAFDPSSHGDDEGIRSRLLSLFYTQRRSNMSNPGMGGVELARLAGCPYEIIEFHLWYLREKNWIQRLETGLLAITADGVDATESRRRRTELPRLIESRTDHAATG